MGVSSRWNDEPVFITVWSILKVLVIRPKSRQSKSKLGFYFVFHIKRNEYQFADISLDCGKLQWDFFTTTLLIKQETDDFNFPK